MFDVSNSQLEIEVIVNDIVNKIYDNRSNDNFYIKGVFNTNQLPNHKNYTYFPNIDNKFRDIIFKNLNIIRENHCLYWFELSSNAKTKELNSFINEYRKKNNEISYKKVPASNTYDDSNILYLGVRQGGYRKKDGLTNIEGRILQHLGYNEEGSTQGLQLYEYARNKDFEITIKVIEFKGLKPYLLNVIEKLLAKKMKPLCGKH